MASNPVYYAKSGDDNFFRKRHITTVTFGLALLLFLLPFAEVRCGSIALLKNSGVGLAVGSDWSSGVTGNELLNKYKSETRETKNGLNSGMNVFLLVAIAAGIFGLFVIFSQQNWKHTAAMCAGILACLMLIAALIQLKMLLKAEFNDTADQERSEGIQESMTSMVKMSPTIWYYFSLVSFGCAAFFSFKKHKLEMEDKLKQYTEFDFQQEQRTDPSGLQS